MSVLGEDIQGRGRYPLIVPGPPMLTAASLLILVNHSSPQGPQTPLDPTYGRPLPKQGVRPKATPDASWIWTKRTEADQTIYARKRFSLARTPRRAMLYLTADNDFAVYVNGQEAGKTPSSKGNGEIWKEVQAIDVTARLKPGSNVVAVRAHNDGDAAGLTVRLEADSKLALASDKSWKVSESVPSPGWTEASFDDSGWAAAAEEGRVGEGPWGGNLQGWPVEMGSLPSYLSHLILPPVRWAYAGDPDAMDWHPASSRMSIERPAGKAGQGWRVVLDFGKELTGRVLTDGSTSGLTLGTGESSGEALEKPWTTTAGTKSPNTALRYVTITVPPQLARVDLNARLDHIYYPVRYRGRFDCSDPLLTKVWYTGAYTAHLCMQDDIWDGVKRDRWRWMGDLHVSGEVINNVFADRFLMERTMTSLRQDVQGGRRSSEPPKAHVNGITGYSYSWVAGLADYYRHLGGTAYLQSQHDALVSMLEFCAQEVDEEGNYSNRHKSWVFVDWSPELGQESPVARATTQLFLYKGLIEGAYLLRELGDGPNAAKYEALAKRVERASQAHLVSPSGTFGDRKQENAMAIYSGVATPTQAAGIFKSGVFKPESKPTEFNVSPYYGNYVLHAMGMAERTQDGLDYVRGFYGQMVKDGATTFYEHYDPTWNKRNFHSHLQWGENDNAAAGYHVSLCHGWSAGPTTFLTEYVLGVRSTGGGFKTCAIAPRLGDLAWASGVVPTPSGEITVRVDRKPSGMALKVKIPKATTAVVSLPASIRTVDGKPTSGSSVRLGTGAHVIVGS